MTPRDYALMAYNLYHEARGEPWRGKVAVAHVVFNRMEQKGWTAERVIRQPWQFSWHNNGVFPSVHNFPIYLDCLDAVEQALVEQQSGFNFFNSDHYFADYIPPPKWSRDMLFIEQIGRHKFFSSGR